MANNRPMTEDEKKLLLEAVKEQPFDLFYYGKFLVKEYPEEIYALCEKYIREKCAQATDRRLYKKVCKDLLQLIKWKGNVAAKALVEEFKMAYPRRTAESGEETIMNDKKSFVEEYS